MSAAAKQQKCRQIESIEQDLLAKARLLLPVVSKKIIFFGNGAVGKVSAAFACVAH